jgi:tetraacyldisaccharide 4'-kinase
MNSKFVYIQRVALFPFAVFYGIVIWIRNLLFDIHILPSKEYNIPVISVGNLTVGGTGKTPHVEYLINLLRKDFVVAMLSRGYKRKTRGFVVADKNSTVKDIGDEPLQIKLKFDDIIVAVDANRCRGIEKLVNLNKKLQVIILDDAYQHRYIKPGISILLVDYNRNILHDHLLPLGRLREPVSERSRADIIIVTKCPDEIKPIDMRLLEERLKMYAYQKVFFTKIKYLPLKPVFSNEIAPITLEELSSQQDEVIIFSGIANNESIIKNLRKYFTVVHEFQFRDHYNYSARDLHELIELYSEISDNKPISIITTEKDAVKLITFNSIEEDIKRVFFYLPIEVEFLEDKESFDTYIHNYVSNNKPDNILHRLRPQKNSMKVKI